MKLSNKNKVLSLKMLTKGNVWDIQENDVFRMLENAEKDSEVRETPRKYVDIIRVAFVIETIDDDSDIMKSKYIRLGYKVGRVRIMDGNGVTWAIKKRPIVRVSDLTYENITHISAAKLVEVLDRNFGGGWDSLSQSVKDIIESGFDISTTTLPKDKLHKAGGMYEKKVADGYDVLEIPKGAWVEAIFAKAKPQMEKPRVVLQQSQTDEDDIQQYDDNEDDVELPEDTYNKPDEDDIEPEEPTTFDDEEITEENYRTTFEIEESDDEDVGEIDFLGDE